jgi:chloramphenicol 3-O-phosphotransferase
MDLPPPPGALDQLHLRYRGALLLANLYRQSGFDAVISDNLFEEGVDLILSSALDGDLADTVHFVMLDPSIDAIRERYDQRPGGGYTDSITPQALKLSVSRTARHGLWLDTSRQCVEETTVEILSRLSQARVTPSDLRTQQPPSARQ